MPAAVSIGLAGGVPVQAIVETATAAERAGLRALWLNETPGVDALAGLAAAAATERLLLGVGVVPLDRFPAAVLAAAAAWITVAALDRRTPRADDAS